MPAVLKYRPRGYADEPALFGKTDKIGWNPAPPGEEPLLVAAQQQHRVSMLIAEQISQQYGSVQRYAQAIGIDYQRFTKMLRGVALMRLEDVTTARLHLGTTIPLLVGEDCPTRQKEASLPGTACGKR